jgi:hypothetical protein
MRATKRVPLKALIDDALKLAAAAGHRSVRRVLVWEKSALPRCVFLTGEERREDKGR